MNLSVVSASNPQAVGQAYNTAHQFQHAPCQATPPCSYLDNLEGFAPRLPRNEARGGIAFTGGYLQGQASYGYALPHTTDNGLDAAMAWYMGTVA